MEAGLEGPISSPTHVLQPHPNLELRLHVQLDLDWYLISTN